MSEIDSANKLLTGMTIEEFGLLRPHLKPTSFKLGDHLWEPEQALPFAYFPSFGIISLTSGGSDPVEVAIVGHEGFAGIPLVLGVHEASHVAIAQSDGRGFAIDAEAFARICEQDGRFRLQLLRFVNEYITQVTWTAHANARLTVEERLARWLVICFDRMGSELTLTHDFIATMLGVRRPGVTVALHVLEGHGWIRSTRGRVLIKDREGLVGFYGKREGARSLQPSPGHQSEDPSAEDRQVP